MLPQQSAIRFPDGIRKIVAVVAVVGLLAAPGALEGVVEGVVDVVVGNVYA